MDVKLLRGVCIMSWHRRPLMKPGRREETPDKEPAGENSPQATQKEAAQSEKTKELLLGERIARLDRIRNYQEMISSKSRPIQASEKELLPETGPVLPVQEERAKQTVDSGPTAELYDFSGRKFVSVRPGVFSFKPSVLLHENKPPAGGGFGFPADLLESALPFLLDGYRKTGKTHTGLPVYSFI